MLYLMAVAAENTLHPTFPDMDRTKIAANISDLIEDLVKNKLISNPS